MTDFNSTLINEEVEIVDQIIDNFNLPVPENLNDPLETGLEKPVLERSYNREEAFDAEGLPEGAEKVSAWVTHDEEDLLQMFSDLNAFKEGTDRVEWDKIDYEVYGEDWYRMKYPNFPDEWYELLVKASQEKYKDLTKDDNKGFTRETGNFTVKFD